VSVKPTGAGADLTISCEGAKLAKEMIIYINNFGVLASLRENEPD